MNNRGQASPLAEEVILLVIIVLALSTYLLLLNDLYTAYTLQHNIEKTSFKAKQVASALASGWAYTVAQNTTYLRLVDSAKACSGCPENIGVEVIDLKTKQVICSCGTIRGGARAEVPVAIRYSIIDVRPGMIAVTLSN